VQAKLEACPEPVEGLRNLHAGMRALLELDKLFAQLRSFPMQNRHAPWKRESLGPGISRIEKQDVTDGS